MSSEISSDTNAVLWDLKSSRIPVNIVLTGPPHIGKKILLGFMCEYFGAEAPQLQRSSETIASIKSWNSVRKSMNLWNPEQVAQELDLRMKQKAAIFSRSAIKVLETRICNMEKEVREKLSKLIAGGAEKVKEEASVKKKSSKRRVPREDPRPCDNIRIYLGSCTTDIFCRGISLWTHKLIQKEAYHFAKDQMRHFYWQQENLACPTHHTLFVNLDPDQDLYVMKVYAYFDTVVCAKLPKEVQLEEKQKLEYRERYTALCLEYRTRFAHFFLEQFDFVSRFQTINIRFENDFVAFPLACKLVCDVIALHIQKLVKCGALTASSMPRSKDPEDEDATDFSDLDRTYHIPRVRITGSLVTRSHLPTLMLSPKRRQKEMAKFEEISLESPRAKTSPRAATSSPRVKSPPPLPLALLEEQDSPTSSSVSDEENQPKQKLDRKSVDTIIASASPRDLVARVVQGHNEAITSASSNT